MNNNILHRSLMGGKKEVLTIHDYMTIEALEDGLTAKLSRSACEYCIDGSMEWTALAADTETPPINAGQTLSFRADKPSVATNYGIGTFTISHRCNLIGNCMAMYHKDNAKYEKYISRDYQFYKLFYGNTTIINVSEDFLPATSMRERCYSSIFEGCSNLLSSPVLSAKSLDDHCYSNMFYGCASLTTAPELPATTLASYCYYGMFWGCTSLTTAPELPATKVNGSSYHGMFYGCASLTTAPELPATKVDNSSYRMMFYGCTSLTTAPELPATTLGSMCYEYMFKGCTSLTTAPELPATTLANYCYRYMFENCTSLVNAPELPATTLKQECYKYMFSNCNKLATAPKLPATTLANSCYAYMFSGCKKLTLAPDLPATTLASACYEYMFNTCTSLVNAPELPATTLAEKCYNYMFSNCTSFTSTPELPSTELANECYYAMFNSCKSLTEVKALPSLTLAEQCYERMFYGCTSLTTAPELPATTLAYRCYVEMFKDCTSLVNAPELPATTLASTCYFVMFDGCKALTNAPVLPATTLVEHCYNKMFYNCSKLNNITMLAKDISATGCLSNWVSGVSASGTFVKNMEAEWEEVGVSGVPSGWEIVYNLTPIECLSLTITADDVNGRATTTIIHYTAEILAQDLDGNIVHATISGDAVSEEFPQNTSETETLAREVSFTYIGVTATTTFTQGVWVNQSYIVDLNSNWQLSSDIANPNSATYDGVYESFSNKGVNSKAAIMYIDIVGYETFQLYIRSYAESSYDYVMVSQLDQTINNDTSYSNTTLVKAHTRGSQSSGTAIGNYKLVEFTGIDGEEHRITIVYRKDGSSASGTDRGYVLIPKNQ